MRATSFGGHGHRTERIGGAQGRQPRGQHCRTNPSYAAATFRCGEIFHAQLDLFGPPPSADPLLGLAVKLPNTCSKCADLVAIIGPGKPPHSASLLCRSCGLHRGWISRANYTFLTEIINKFGAPTEPIVFRNRSTRPEQNDEGVSVVQVAIKPGGENGNTI